MTYQPLYAHPNREIAAPAETPATPRLRRYHVCARLPSGAIAQTQHLAPAHPIFEDAFCAFARGSLVETQSGPVAIEDLLPGDHILTQSHEALPLLWIGRVTVAPTLTEVNPRDMSLTRILTDSFGENRPLSCVLTGPAARVLGRDAEGEILKPVCDLRDGNGVIDTRPPTAVDLFHLCLSKHAIIRISGLQFETYHPGKLLEHTLSKATAATYLNLFPHISKVSDFGDLIHPRADDATLIPRTA